MEEQALASGKTFVWHEVYGPSSSASVEFYTKTLGWTVEEMDMGPMGTYKMLVANGKPICGVIGTSEMPGMDQVPPHWSTYISVDDVDARVATAQENGATLMQGPWDVPTVGRMALLRDPQGAVIWFFKGTDGM